MFIGTYEHNMDSKNRVFVPVKFREELGETIYYRLYASKENPSIQLYSKDAFEREFSNTAPTANNQAKKKKQLMPIFLTANVASYDSQGRITISSVIADTAGLEKACIFVGFGSYVELMSKKSYNASLQMVCEANEADEAAVDKEADVYREMMGEGKLLGIEVE